MKNILFVLAHPDDEAFGPGGTIAKLSKDNHVTVVVLCNGDRPYDRQVGAIRRKAFAKSCRVLGVVTWSIFGADDTTLTYEYAKEKIEVAVNTYKPHAVYTHNISDIHQDHQITAEATMVACRAKPELMIQELYMCEIPSSTGWAFGQIEPVFVPNTYVDIANESSLKQQALMLYSTEVHTFPDARSWGAVDGLAAYRGQQVGVERAEAFKQIYRLC